MEQKIIGQVPSKSNSYMIGKIGGHYTILKKAAVKRYERQFLLQCNHYRDWKYGGLFKIAIDVFCSTMSHDLDNTLKVVLDCLQYCNAIKNDNQCIDIHARKFIDKKEPRIEFSLIPCDESGHSSIEFGAEDQKDIDNMMFGY